MKKIGILFGVENSFPSALAAEINARNAAGIAAEFVSTGAIRMGDQPAYAVLIDRISHEVPFYRAFLKQAALGGAVVLNDPFWSSTDDKFLNYSLAARLGVAVPQTVLLPHKHVPGGLSARSLRNLEYPLDWESVFAYAGEHGFLKPIDGGGWRDVHEVRSRDEFFQAYDRTRSLCMVYQRAIVHERYYRCYVVGQKAVRVMAYDPSLPQADRYRKAAFPSNPALIERIERDAITLSTALGYQINSVEFAVENSTPYAIDFMNPVPDADFHSVGREHFDWFVQAVADLAIAKARRAPSETKPAAGALLEPPKNAAEAEKKLSRTAKRRMRKKLLKAAWAATPPAGEKSS